ncbi:MAG: hypothetical protein KDA54_01885 [Phycisphaerales bacterium]|nr:hypothetical protein [Phycisphaerales bacterium]
MTLVGYSLLGAAFLALIFGVVAWWRSSSAAACALLWAAVFGASGWIWGAADLTAAAPGDLVGPLTIWIVAIGLILTAFIAAEGFIEHQRAWRELRQTPHKIGDHSMEWVGLDDSCTSLGLMLLIAVFAQLSMVLKCHWASERLVALILGVSSIVTGISLLRLVTRRWRIGLADIGLGLLSVGVATLLLTVLPFEPIALEARFPARFNTIIIGLTVMMWVWIWLYGVWHQQLDDGVAWTTAGHMRSRLPRIIVALAVISLVAAGMMSGWPRLRLIGGHDATFLRIGFGVIGHLFLILTLIMLARRWKHAPLGVLAGVASLSLCAFLVIRLSVFSEIET